MLEEEAKTKFCPFMFSGGYRDRCVASACMAWTGGSRRVWFVTRDGVTSTYNWDPTGDPYHLGAHIIEGIIGENGHCGLVLK